MGSNGIFRPSPLLRLLTARRVLGRWFCRALAATQRSNMPPPATLVADRQGGMPLSSMTQQQRRRRALGLLPLACLLVVLLTWAGDSCEPSMYTSRLEFLSLGMLLTPNACDLWSLLTPPHVVPGSPKARPWEAPDAAAAAGQEGLCKGMIAWHRCCSSLR